jgi:hypothetical protein
MGLPVLRDSMASIPFCSGVSSKGVCSIGSLYQEKPRFATRLPLQPRRACRVSHRVHDGVLNVPVPQIALTQPRVCPLICKSEAARMAQHVWVHFDR